MNILIYEDNEEDLDNLLTCINQFFAMIEVAYTVKVCTNSKYVFENHSNYDLIFLDIEVFGENGIDIGYKVRKQNHDIRIMFVTSYAKYLKDGYKAQANRYFVKPIQQDDFNIELRNVISDYLDEYDGFFDETISLDKTYYKKIVYIEFITRKTRIHFLSGEEIVTRYPLKFWLQKLTNKGFAQPYKSLLVNLRYVSGFTKHEVILDNEQLLPTSRRFRHEFESKYITHLHKRI